MQSLREKSQYINNAIKHTILIQHIRFYITKTIYVFIL